MHPVRYSFDAFVLDVPSLKLTREGEPVRLGQRALNLLGVLVEAQGALVTRDALMQRVWPNQAVDEGAIRVHLSAARKALAAGSASIVAEAGRGYRLTLPVTVHGEEVPAPAPPPAWRSNIPARLSGIVGRDAIVGSIAAELGARRFISLIGQGIGKTTAALAVVRRAVETDPQDAWFVDLAPLADEARVASTLATALGAPAAGADPVAQIAAWLAPRRGILLLDNCEHVIDAAALLVERLLQSAPRLLVLATSREPLRSEGEWVHRLAPLDLPRDIDRADIARAADYSAIELFDQRAKAANSGFVLDPANLPAVIEICERLDGIPLAIELAAARIDAMTPATIASGLDDRFALLSRGRRTALPRHRSLRGVLDWSYDLLDPGARDLLDRLSLFRNGFDAEGATAMGAGAGIDPRAAVALLGELTAKSLIVATPAGVLPYRLLDTTRHYGLARLADADAVDPASRDHAAYLLRRLAASASAWEGKALREWLAAYSVQIDDVRSAIAWASRASGSADDAELAAELVIAAAPLWFHLSLPGEFLTHARTAIALMDKGGVRGERQIELLTAYGHALWHTHGPVAAMADTFRRAEDLAETLGAKPLVLRALWGVWAQSILDGRYAASLALAQRFDAGVGPHGVLSDRQTAAHMLALSHHFSGDHAQAEAMLAIVMAGDAVPERANHANHAQVDGKIAVMSLAMRLSWMRGDMAGALALARDCAEDIERIDHALSACYGLAIGCIPVAIAAGEGDLARRWVTALAGRTRRHGLDHWDAFVSGYGTVLGMAVPPAGSVSGMQAEMFAVAADPHASIPWNSAPA